MKNLSLVKNEILSRRNYDVLRGRTENAADTFRRLLFNIGKQWTTHDGKTWTLRAYLLKYDRKEYLSILSCLRRNYKGSTFTQCSPKKSFWYMDELKLNGITY